MKMFIAVLGALFITCVKVGVQSIGPTDPQYLPRAGNGAEINQENVYDDQSATRRTTIWGGIASTRGRRRYMEDCKILWVKSFTFFILFLPPTLLFLHHNIYKSAHENEFLRLLFFQ